MASTESGSRGHAAGHGVVEIRALALAEPRGMLFGRPGRADEARPDRING